MDDSFELAQLGALIEYVLQSVSSSPASRIKFLFVNDNFPELALSVNAFGEVS